MGSTVTHITKKAECPILILKDFQPRSKKDNESYNWVICTDGSEGSRRAFNSMSSLVNKDKDTVTVLAVKTEGFDTEKLEAHCKVGFEKQGVKGSVVVLPFEVGKKIDTTLLEYIHDEKTPYVDFVSVRLDLSKDWTIWSEF